VVFNKFYNNIHVLNGFNLQVLSPQKFLELSLFQSFKILHTPNLFFQFQSIAIGSCEKFQWSRRSQSYCCIWCWAPLVREIVRSRFCKIALL